MWCMYLLRLIEQHYFEHGEQHDRTDGYRLISVGRVKLSMVYAHLALLELLSVMPEPLSQQRRGLMEGFSRSLLHDERVNIATKPPHQYQFLQSFLCRCLVLSASKNHDTLATVTSAGTPCRLWPQAGRVTRPDALEVTTPLL